MAEDSQSQQPFHDNTTSIEDLKQQALSILENECLSLEKELEDKRKENAAIRCNIDKQDQNNLKMQHDLEQIKMKTQREIMSKAVCENKLKSLNKECQTLEKYLSQYCKGVNTLLPSVDELKEVLKRKEIISNENEAQCTKIKDNYEKVLSHVIQTAKEMERLKVCEEREFDGIICHLKSQISEKREQKTLLEDRFRQVDSRCKELETKIDMLIPQNNELSNVINKLKSEMAKQKESFESEDATLKTALQEEATKKEKLTEQIGNMNKMIDHTNSVIREQENEAKELDTNFKQLISECDELEQANRSDVEEINKLTREVEEKEETFASLMAIDEENNLLMKQHESLQKTNADLEEKILEKKKKADSHQSQIENLEKLIEEAEKERDQVVKERVCVKERIKNKELEIIENERQHKENCSELDKEHSKLCKTNEHLKKTANERAELFSKLEKQKEKLDSDLSRLKEQFNLSKKKHDNSLDELINLSHGHQIKQLREEVALLEESTGWASRDAQQACFDTQAHREITERIKRLEEQLEHLEEGHGAELEIVHERSSKRVQAKQKSLEELRAQKESEFRRTEEMKTNAGMELTENKRFIEELENKKLLTQNEIKKTNANLEKCNLLMRKLEEKLETVARVAMNSQSIVDSISQTSYLYSTPKPGCTKPPQKIYNSPESDSSGITFNPDKFVEANLSKGAIKKQTKKANTEKKTRAVKPKKKNNKCEDDDWNLNF